MEHMNRCVNHCLTRWVWEKSLSYLQLGMAGRLVKSKKRLRLFGDTHCQQGGFLIIDSASGLFLGFRRGAF